VVLKCFERFARLSMSQNGFGLFTSRSGEPTEEIIEPRPVFQVLEQRFDRDARPFKNPRAAHFAGDSLHGRTLAPIQND
jgi:hypothetical protein